jgi:hypothetical protein
MILTTQEHLLVKGPIVMILLENRVSSAGSTSAKGSNDSLEFAQRIRFQDQSILLKCSKSRSIYGYQAHASLVMAFEHAGGIGCGVL